jgi:hypothetical protein
MKNKCNQPSDSPRKRNRIISDSPKKLPFELIKLVTNDFSEELGRGAFGQVFKVKLIKHEDQTILIYLFLFVSFKSNPYEHACFVCSNPYDHTCFV